MWPRERRVSLGSLLFAVALLSPATGAQSLSQMLHWADTAIQSALNNERISAAGLVIVHGKDAPIVRAYGEQSVATRVAFDAERSIVRLQSVSKVFAAVTLLELVNQGRVGSIDDSANKYLKRMQLKRFGTRDVTLRDLLTHQAGLDPLAYRFSAPASLDVMLTAEQIRDVLPPISREPGPPVTYSNAGYGVIGLIIEDVSGKELDTAMRDLVFTPLAMTSSFVGHPSSSMSSLAFPAGHYPNGERYVDKAPLSHPLLRASGSVYTTLSDMGKFLQWQLAAMEGDDKALKLLLGRQGLGALVSDQVRNHPAIDGQGLAYLHRQWRGHATIEKGGAPNFNTRLLFLPSQRTAFFTVHLNAEPQPRPEDRLLALFGVGRFSPPPRESGLNLRSGMLEALLGTNVRPSLSLSATNASTIPFAALVGEYWLEQRPRVAPWLFMYLPERKRVEVAGDILVIDGEAYDAIGNNAFAPTAQGVPPDQIVSFARNNGTIYLLDIDQAFEQVDGMRKASLIEMGWWVASAFAMTGFIALVWPRAERMHSLAKSAAATLAICAGAVPAAITLGFAPDTSFDTAMMLGESTRLWVLVAASYLTLISTAILVAITCRFLLARPIDWATRLKGLHIALLATAGATLVVVFVQLNWIGHAVPY
jgi:CubicO group peptidase (beta-lactamase class C family)